MPSPILCGPPYSGHPLSRSYRVILPNSLTVNRSSALVYSTRLRVSVYSTGAYKIECVAVFLGSLLTCIIDAPEGLPYFQSQLSWRICLPRSTSTSFNRLFRQSATVSLLRHHLALIYSTGILTGSSIGIAVRLSLRARLTLIRLALIRNP